MSLSLPPQALDSATAVAILDCGLPSPANALTKPLTFGPAGTALAHPGQVTFPLPSDAGSAQVFWGQPLGDGGILYLSLGGSVDGGAVSAQIVYLSEGYLGASSASAALTGSQFIIHQTPERPYDVPTDFTQTPVAALVPLTDGGYATYPGSGFDAGYFVIPNVPNGPAVVAIGDPDAGPVGYYALTVPSAPLDLGSITDGRLNLTPIPLGGSSETQIIFNVNSMGPWQNGDWLEFDAPDANSFYFIIPPYPIAVPDAGDTILNMDLVTSAPWGNYPWSPGYLVQASQGDTATLDQLGFHTNDAGFSYLAMDHVFAADNFDEVADGTVTLNGTFTDVSLEQSADVAVAASQYLAFVAASDGDGGFTPLQVPTGPDIVGYNYMGTLDIEGQPGGLVYGLYGPTADFCVVNVNPGTADFQTGPMGFGEPFDGAWGAFLGMRFGYVVAYQLPQSTAPGFFTYPTVATDDPVTGGVMSVAPRIGPVQNPTIEGLDMLRGGVLSNAAPTVSWTAPALGQPDLYTVSITLLFDDAGNTLGAPVANFVTTATQVIFPPGLLQPGQSYVFQVLAQVNGNPNLALAPNYDDLPDGASLTASGVFTLASGGAGP